MPTLRNPDTRAFVSRPITLDSTRRWTNALALGAHPWDDDDERDFQTDAEKLGALANAALNVAAVSFPLLGKEMWEELLHVQGDATVLFSSVISDAAWGDGCLEYLLQNAGLVVSEAEHDILASLDRRAWLPIKLAANLYWSTRDPDLRSILSHVSCRPRECVFVTDPKPEELWRVVRIDSIDIATRRVVLAFGDDAESGFVNLNREASGRVHIDDVNLYFDPQLPRYCSAPGTNTFLSVAVPLAHAAGLRTFENLREDHITASEASLKRWMDFICPSPHYPPMT